jgi:hypothetical protein
MIHARRGSCVPGRGGKPGKKKGLAESGVSNGFERLLRLLLVLLAMVLQSPPAGY